jgi:hypothetical protein
LRGKGFVEFDHVHLRHREAGQRQHFLRGRRRAYAHDARRDAGRGHADHSRLRREAILCGRGLVGQQQRAGAVVHAAGIAGGHRAVGPHHALELGQRFERGLARMLVLAHHNGSPFFWAIVTGVISASK